MHAQRGLFGLVVLGLLASSAAGETSEALLKRFVDFYQEMPGVAAKYNATIKISSVKMDMTTTQEVRLARPNKLSVKTIEGIGGGNMISDGAQVYVGLPMVKRYTLQPAPKTFATWQESLASSGSPVPIPGVEVLIQLFAENPMENLVAGPDQLDDRGSVELNGNACRHIVSTANGRQVQVWIEEGPLPWLRKFRSGSTAAMADGGDASVDITFEFERWERTTPKDDVFAIKPAAGFTKVDNLFAEPVRGGGPRARARGRGNRGGSGTGTAAPDFAAELLDGTSFKLSQHLGKDVIVLDFWATWCKPCIMGLPIMTEVTGAMADQDVVFYAVNIAETPEKVQKFMDGKSWNFPVVMDRNGKIAKSFGVGPIPHSVVIGRDGKIAHVHVGFSGQLRQQLTRELEGLTKPQPE